MKNRFFDIQRFVSISNSTSDTIIMGTSDADSIKNSGWKDVTVEGGTGDDTIYNYSSNNIQYSEGDGNDVILELVFIND